MRCERVDGKKKRTYRRSVLIAGHTKVTRSALRVLLYQAYMIRDAVLVKQIL